MLRTNPVILSPFLALETRLRFDPRTRVIPRLRAAWSRVTQWFLANTFTPTWLPARWRQPASGYLLAFLCQVLVALFTRLLIELVPTYSFPGVIETLTVAATAVSWGAGPGIFAALVGLVLEEALVLPALPNVDFGEPAVLIEGALFMVVGVGISVIASITERSRRRAVEAYAESQARARAAEQVQAHMDEFLVIASHDLRTPLTALSGFSEIAVRRFETLASTAASRHADLARHVDRVRGSLVEVQHATKRLTRVVRLLFDTVQVTRGLLTLRLARCDLAVVVHDTLRDLREASPDRIIQLDVAVTPPIALFADAERISDVLSNYVTNAFKYSAAGQPVEIRVSMEDEQARVAVRDHGLGLPAREQQRIWDRFYRVEGVRVQSGTAVGLGLGLHLCKAIIEGHGGHVGVESAVGQGSTFWFALPLTAASE
jgi:signal transduction histidine kinase